jgi:lactoylglutathione lyase
MTHNGQPFGRFFFIEDPDGYKIEVLEKGSRPGASWERWR